MTEKVKSLTEVVTGKIRMSYVHIFEPHAISEGQDKKYSLCVLIPKSDTATLRKIKAAVDAAREEGKTSKWNGKIPTGLKLPLRDGDDDRPEQPEYTGHFFLNASSKNKPAIVNEFVAPVLDQTEVYSGCYGRVALNFFAFNSAGNKGVGCGLNAVQKLADGEPLSGGSRSAEEYFDAVSGGGEDDFLS